MKNLILLVAIALLAGCSGSTSVSTDEAITLRLAPKEGDRYSYVMNSEGGDNRTQIGISVVVQKVDPKIITTVASIDSMLSNGKEPPAMILDPLKKMRIINQMDPTGKVLDTKTVDGPETVGKTAGANAVSFPEKPIKVGDTWEGVTQSIGKGVHAMYKLASIDDVDGKRLATIEVTPDSQEGITLEGPIKVQVEVSNGMLYSMSMKSTSKDPDGNDSVFTMEMKRK